MQHAAQKKLEFQQFSAEFLFLYPCNTIDKASSFGKEHVTP